MNDEGDPPACSPGGGHTGTAGRCWSRTVAGNVLDVARVIGSPVLGRSRGWSAERRATPPSGIRVNGQPKAFTSSTPTEFAPLWSTTRNRVVLTPVKVTWLYWLSAVG